MHGQSNKSLWIGVCLCRAQVHSAMGERVHWFTKGLGRVCTQASRSQCAKQVSEKRVCLVRSVSVSLRYMVFDRHAGGWHWKTSRTRGIVVFLVSTRCSRKTDTHSRTIRDGEWEPTSSSTRYVEMICWCLLDYAEGTPTPPLFP